MNSSAPTPDQSLKQKNPFPSLPKKPSHAALSGPRPLVDMLLARSFFSHMRIYPGHRQCPPRSEWIVAAAPGHLRAMAFSRLELAGSLVGRVPIDHATVLPSKQSITGLR